MTGVSKKNDGGASPQRCVADGLREAQRLDINPHIHLPRRKLAAKEVAALRPAGNEDGDGINLGPGSGDTRFSLQSCTPLSHLHPKPRQEKRGVKRGSS